MHFRRATALTATLVLAQQSSAQGLGDAFGNISTSCQSAATSLVSSNFATCSNLLGLVTIFTGSGSLVDGVNSWLGGLCPATCSDQTIQQANSTIQQGCSSDISSGQPAAVGLSQIVGNFKTYKSALCLQATSNSTYCTTNLLSTVQNATGTQLTTSYLLQLFQGDLLRSLATSIPAGQLCTDCAHGLVTKLRPALESASATASGTSSASSAIASTCGQGFLDGQVPSTVKEGGAQASGSSGSGSGSTGSAYRIGVATVAPVLAAVGVVAGGLFVLA